MDIKVMLFDYPLNLHISQTDQFPFPAPLSFDYPLNLHISQTCDDVPVLR